MMRLKSQLLSSSPKSNPELLLRVNLFTSAAGLSLNMILNWSSLGTRMRKNWQLDQDSGSLKNLDMLLWIFFTLILRMKVKQL